MNNQQSKEMDKNKNKWKTKQKRNGYKQNKKKQNKKKEMKKNIPFELRLNPPSLSPESESAPHCNTMAPMKFFC